MGGRQSSLRLALRNPGVAAGGGILVLLVAMALAAPLLTAFDPTELT
ncbi:MAG: ABC transporter permease, partial [Candidatus Sumerlaeia bacterium]|nr:ABC transporter permease [Candidatus Sumerlaeia bacterium]